MAALVVVLLVFVVGGCSSSSEVLVDQRGEVGPEPSSKTERFAVRIADLDRPVGVSASAGLKSGGGVVRLSGPDGEELFAAELDADHGSDAKVLGSIPSGDLQVTVELEEAVGKWHVTVLHTSEQEALRVTLTAGLLVLLLVAAVVWITRRRFEERFRWLWIGAALWAVAVLFKVVSSFLAMEPVLEALEGALPHWLYIAAGSVFVGLHSALFEIGLTIVAAYLWKSFWASKDRAMTIGVGAGAFEAALIGLSSIGGAVAVMVGVQELIVAVSSQCATTPLAWLVAPVERALTIPVHVASRLLVFYGVARGRRLNILLGFVLFMLIDAVAGGAHVAGLVGRVSTWWIEAAIVPFALLSLYAILRVTRSWNKTEGPILDDT